MQHPVAASLLWSAALLVIGSTGVEWITSCLTLPVMLKRGPVNR